MINTPTFAKQQAEWSKPPIDDVGYLNSKTLLTYGDKQLDLLISNFEHTRYQGWRNYNNAWIRLFQFQETNNKSILDYGTGTGIEALQYNKNKPITKHNEISIADIAPENLQLASKIFTLRQQTRPEPFLIQEHYPFIQEVNATFDVIHCSGVLHHIPNPRQVMERFHELLTSNGELRLMVYSDIGWRIYTDTEPPTDIPTQEHPKYQQFLRTFDQVGFWAEWYSPLKIYNMFSDIFTMSHVEYLTPDQRYLGIRLQRR